MWEFFIRFSHSIFRTKQRSRRALSVRPELWPLEDRLVPAQLLWVGAAGAPWAPAMGNNPNFINQGGVAQNPSNGDTLIFDPNARWGPNNTPGADTDSVDNTNPEIFLSAIHVNQAYTHNITINSYLIVGKAGVGQVSSDPSNLSNGTLTLMKLNGTGAQPEFEIYGSAGSGSTFNWSGGNIANGNPANSGNWPHIKVDGRSTFNISGGAASLQADIWNSGLVNFSANQDLTLSNTSYGITNSGTFNLMSDHGLLSLAGDPRAPFGFSNSSNGLLEKTGGTGTSTFGLNFGNSRASSDLEIYSGTINFTQQAGQSAGLTTIYRGATLQTSTTYTVNGGTIEGAIQGSGAAPRVLGNLTLAGGDFFVESGGMVPSVFVVTNNFSETGGTLHIYVNGWNGNDQLQVGNQARLGGILKVTTISAPMTSPFTIMTYGSLAQGTDFASFTWDSLVYTPDKQNNQYQLS
jgi:hypothetical protein